MQALWQKIYEESVAELAGQSYAAGEQYCTVESLAKRYNVSAITARRVLSELAQAGYVKNIPRRGCVVAGRRRSSHGGISCYFLPPDRPQSNPVPYATIQQGLFTAASDNGLSLELVTLEQLPELGRGHRHALLFNIWNSLHIPASVFYHVLPENVFPVALGANLVSEDKGLHIGTASYETMVRMVGQFAASGHRRIAYMGPCENPTFGPRFKGYLQGLAENGMDFDLSLLFHIPSGSNASASEVRDWLAQVAPEAICTAGTEFSLLLMRVLEDAGMPWTGPVATMGCATQRHPKVALYRTDFLSEGARAVELAIQMMGDNGDLKIPSQRYYPISSIFESK